MLHQNAHIWFSLHPLPSNEYKCGCMSIFNLYGQALWREITNVTGYNKRPMTGALHALFPSCREQTKTQAAWSENTWNLCRSSDTPADNTTCTDGVDCCWCALMALHSGYTQQRKRKRKRKKSQMSLSSVDHVSSVDHRLRRFPRLENQRNHLCRLVAKKKKKKNPHSYDLIFYVLRNLLTSIIWEISR